MKSWVIFQDLEARYFHLRRQSERGQITQQQFLAAAQHLRTQDNHGAWWQVRPEDGTWQHWNGNDWVPAIPPQFIGPETLVEFIYALLKELFQGLLWKLPVAIGAALIVWAIHTFLVVGINGGLTSERNALLDMALSLPGQLAPGIIFWFTLACLVSIILMRLREMGLEQVLLYMTEAPAWIEYALSGSEGNVLVSLLLGCALALVIGVIIGNRLVSFLLVIMGLGAIISQDKSLILWALRLAWSDGLRLLNRPPQPFNPAWGGLILIGSVFGLMGAVVLPLMPYTGCVGIFLLVGLVTLLILTRQGNHSRAVGLLLVPMLVFSYPTHAPQITISELGVVIAYGILPAWGAFCGTLFGLSLGMWKRTRPRSEAGKVEPKRGRVGLQPEAWKSPEYASASAQPPSPQLPDVQVILKGQPALDVLDRLGMIKRKATPQGMRYAPVALEPQGPISGMAFFLDEQGYLIPQLAIAYSPPTPAPEQIEIEMQSEEALPSVENVEASQPAGEDHSEASPADIPKKPDDFQPPGREQAP
jgi:hypothetical protein